jgi:hypothetical protein
VARWLLSALYDSIFDDRAQAVPCVIHLAKVVRHCASREMVPGLIPARGRPFALKDGPLTFLIGAYKFITVERDTHVS